MADPTVKVRPWCAKAQYPGLAEFTLGTIILEEGAASHEIEAALYKHGHSFLPEGFTVIQPMCGAIFFVSEDEFQ